MAVMAVAGFPGTTASCQEDLGCIHLRSPRNKNNKTSSTHDDDDDNVTGNDSSSSSAPSSSSSSYILKEHIRLIQDYLDENSRRPMQQIQQQSKLLDALDDLQDELKSHDDSDNTAARDFYALGGWPLLASLVSPSVHHHHHHDDNNGMEVENILMIRAAAAAALGNAVHNTSPFDDSQTWVLDNIQLKDATMTATTTTNALELVVQALVEVSSAASSPLDSCSPSTLDAQQALAKAAVRALRSFLLAGNGNSHAAAQVQVAFANNMEPAASMLGHQAAEWAAEAATRIEQGNAANTATSGSAATENVPMSRHAMKMTALLLSLATDVVLNDIAHAEEKGSSNSIVVNVFSSTDWCLAALQAATLEPVSSFQQLVFEPLQATALQAVVTLGKTPSCFAYYHEHGNTRAGEVAMTRLYHQLHASTKTTTTTTRTTKRNLRPRIQ